MSMNVPTPYQMYLFKYVRDMFIAGSRYGFMKAKGYFNTSQQKQKKIDKEMKNFNPEVNSGQMFDIRFTEIFFKILNAVEIINKEKIKYDEYENDLILYVAQQQSVGNIKRSFD